MKRDRKSSTSDKPSVQRQLAMLECDGSRAVDVAGRKPEARGPHAPFELEREVQRSSLFLGAVIENANVWLNVLDERKNVVLWNRAAELISGYSREEVVGHGKIWEWLYPDQTYRKEVTDSLNDVLQKGRAEQDVETSIRRKDGETRVISWNERNLLGAHGEAIGSVAIGRDVTYHKRTEQKLRESEEKYRAIVENSSDMISIVQDNCLKYVNQAMCARLGWTSDEMMSPSFNFLENFVAPGYRSVVAQNMARRLKGEPIPPYEVNAVTRDGTEFPVIVRATRISYRGKPAEAVTVTDITERKRLEEALRRRARELGSLQETLLEITSQHELSQLLNCIVERAAALLDAPGGGMYLCDPDKREVRCVVGYNTKIDPVGTVLKYGEGAAGVVAQTGKPLIINDYRSWSGRAAAYEKAKPFGAVATAPMVWQGQVIGVIQLLDHAHSQRFTPADLDLLTLFANHAAIAVENQRHSENLERMVEERTTKLTESQHELQLIADSVPAAIGYVDRQQRYVFNNKTYEEWFGQSRGDIAGQHVRDIIGEQVYEKIQGPLEAALSGVTQAFEHELTSRSGNRQVSVTYVPDFGEHGQVKGIFVLGIDVTERKMMEERLLKAEHMAAVGETAAMVGHDLRNPLQGITGAIHLLRKESLTEKEKDEMLQLIQDSVHYSDTIVRDLTEYSTEIHLEPTETTPKSIIRDALRTVRVPKKITFHDLSEEHPVVTADQDMIRRAIVNIIENAIDAMPQGGTLTISSRQFDGGVEVDISDTGPGMPEEVLQNLWKPLQTTKAKGLGLGLANCKRIVDAHGGKISVDSKPGEGTTITIGLPLNAHVLEVNEKKE